MTLSEILPFAVLAAVTIFFFYNFLYLKKRIQYLEKKMENLQVISHYFPEFIQQGVNLTKDISGQLSEKQSVLKKLILEAEKSSEKLGYLEDKIKENKLDQETINKILILVNNGFSSEEISPKLNIPTGEIDLVVKLRKYLSAPIKEKL